MNRVTRFMSVAVATCLLPLGAMASDGGSPGDGSNADFSSFRNLTITEVALASGGEFDHRRYDFDILLNAVLAAGLEGPLGDPNADLTLFAPTDIAFIRTARDLGFTGWDEEGAFNYIVTALTGLGNGDPIPLLTSILLYHVSPEAKWFGNVKNSGGVDTLLEGADILPADRRMMDNDPDIQDAFISKIGVNIRVANGIIHKISRVMLPLDIVNPDESTLPTITEIVVASGGEFDNNDKDFDILLNAVLAAGLEGALNDPNDSLTVVAPDDAAFIRTAKQLGFTGSGEADAFAFIVTALDGLSGGDPIALLTDILLYHVIPGDLTAKDVLQGGETMTAVGASFVAKSKIRKLVDNNPSTSNPLLMVWRANIRASNGFVQPINRVLLPVDISTLP